MSGIPVPVVLPHVPAGGCISALSAWFSDDDAHLHEKERTGTDDAPHRMAGEEHRLHQNFQSVYPRQPATGDGCHEIPPSSAQGQKSGDRSAKSGDCHSGSERKRWHKAMLKVCVPDDDVVL